MKDIIISGFADEISSSLDEQIAVLKELGMSYMCPRGIDGKNIADYTLEDFEQKVKPRLVAAGIGFSSIGSPIGKIDLYDDAAFEHQQQQLRELIKICRSMDCKYIRIFSFFVHADYEKALPVVLKKLNVFLDIAEGSGVKLLHENEKEIYGDIPSRVLDIHRGISREGLGFIYDASNYIQCGANAKEAFEAVADFTEYYHIKDCMADTRVEVPIGMGDGDYDYLISHIIARGYQGFMTLEPHTMKYALAKVKLNLLPFLGIFVKGWRKTFKRIDKAYGKKPLESVSRREVFIWQYNGLTALLDKYAQQ